MNESSSFELTDGFSSIFNRVFKESKIIMLLIIFIIFGNVSKEIR